MKLKIRPSRSLKIAVQTAVFAAWAGLISVTHYPLDSWIARHVPVSLFLRADPLVTTVVWGGMRVGVTILMLGLFTFGITLLLGRVFCGWICPLGSIFDFYSWALNKFKIKQQARSPSFFRFKYYLLAATLVLVAFGVGAPLIALDPIVLLTRTAAAVIEPFFRDSGHAIAPGILEYRHLAYGHLIDLSTLALFIGIMAYTTRVSRVWCRTACPLGAYLAASSSFAVLRRETKDCIQCGICAEKCPTGAIDFKDATQYSESECIKCFVCDDECPVDANFFTLKVPLT